MNSYRGALKDARKSFRLAELKRDGKLYGLASELFLKCAALNKNPDSTLNELNMARYSAIKAGDKETAYTIQGAILLEELFRRTESEDSTRPEDIKLKTGQTLGDYMHLLNYAFEESSRLFGIGAYDEAENVLGKIASEILDDNVSKALLREVVNVRESHADIKYANGYFREAISLYMSAAKYAENIQYVDDSDRILLKVIEKRISRAESFIAAGELAEAIKDYDEAIKIAKAIGEESIAKALSEKKDLLHKKK